MRHQQMHRRLSTGAVVQASQPSSKSARLTCHNALQRTANSVKQSKATAPILCLPPFRSAISRKASESQNTKKHQQVQAWSFYCGAH
jgi:hypothetical protein